MNDEENLTEEEIDARIAAKTEAKKPRGRPRNSNYISFDEARQFIREQLLPSRGKFEEWWDREKPKTIPRFPYRVYKEWVSWNDFLGNDNKFNEKIGTKWRPFLEATAWSMKLNLKTMQEWLDFCRTDDGVLLPEDIPARPDLVYNEWRSWNHWLGNKPIDAIKARQEVAAKIQVFYIIHRPNKPQNVLKFGIERDGLTAMKAWWEDEQFTIVRLFWYDPEKGELVKNIIDAFSTPYMDSESERIVPNVWEIVYHLQMHLEQITSKDVK